MDVCPSAPGAPLFERLYARLGARYFDALLAGLWLALVVGVIPTYCAFFLVPVFDLDLPTYGECVLAFEVVLGLVAGPGMFLIARRRLRAMYGWMAGREVAPRAAWSSAVGDPPLTIVVVLAWFAAWSVLPVLYVGGALEFGWLATVNYYLVILGLIAMVGVFVYLGLDQALRPVVRQIAAALPGGPPPVRVPTLAQKVLLLVPAISFFTAFVVGALAAVDVDPETYMAILLGLAVTVSCTMSLLLTLMLRRSLLARVDELRVAMQRVDSGDLAVRVDPVAGDELDELGGSFNAMVEGLRERQRLQDAFGSYVDPGLAERVLREGKSLTGDRFDVSVLILDVRDFTWLSSRSDPEHVVAYLNELFELVVPVVLRHGGHPNKLLGDGLLAAFGAPEALPDHADAATAAGLEILDAVDARYHGELRVGIGIDSGEVVAGTMGGGGKLDYTLIGDPVNLAARLEALTKERDTSMLISAATNARLSAVRGAAFESLGTQTVRGRNRPVEIFRPTAADD